MKNIHVLPTENESRLRYNSFNKVYELCEFPKYHTDIKSTHNIYITSDEEIKEGDWYLNNGHLLKCTESKIRSNCKKIILTTDQDLIKYGVQAIDDEFLEWFVKNPSCESVEVEKMFNVVQFTSREYIYKIFIPKEEPKPIDQQIINCVGGEERFKQIAKIQPKQETLEEATERIFPIKLMYFPKEVIDLNEEPRNIFFKGAKWQQEQFGKSEFLQKLRATLSDAEARRLIFEQFKNK